MEILYFFQACKRHLKVILLISLLAAAITGIYWSKFVAPDFKSTIFFSTVTKVDNARTTERYDPFSYAQSADSFAEGMLGWFRNPNFFVYMKEHVPAAANLRLDRMYQIRKQEKQNLNITFQVETRALAEDLQEATMKYLREQIANINTQSNTTYDIINETFNITEVKYNTLLVTSVVFFSLFLLLTLFFLLWEIFRGIASVREQVEEILGTTALDTVHGTKADLGFIANYVAKQGSHVAIGGVGKSYPVYFKKISEYIANTLGKETIVVDVDLKNRTLAKSFGLSEHMKKMKGITDFDEKTADISKVSLPIKKESSLLKFIGAGTGNIPHYAFLEKNLPENAKILLHMELPKDTHIFQMKDLSLVLFVQLGVTKLLDLKRIKKLIGDTPVGVVIVE
ncbi:MAG: hypothetical protein ACK4NC_01305 [Candidatus Gracilibacteria bacterium]